MRAGLFLIAAALAAPAFAQSVPPMVAFIRAADNGDAAAMMAALGKDKLPREIEGCYLRRVYGNPEGGVLAAWMCAEGEKASRVVLAEVGQADGKAQMRIVRETRNKVPAPPRSGPALAPDPAPEAQK